MSVLPEASSPPSSFPSLDLNHLILLPCLPSCSPSFCSSSPDFLSPHANYVPLNFRLPSPIYFLPAFLLSLLPSSSAFWVKQTLLLLCASGHSHLSTLSLPLSSLLLPVRLLPLTPALPQTPVPHPSLRHTASAFCPSSSLPHGSPALLSRLITSHTVITVPEPPALVTHLLPSSCHLGTVLTSLRPYVLHLPKSLPPLLPSLLPLTSFLCFALLAHVPFSKAFGSPQPLVTSPMPPLLSRFSVSCCLSSRPLSFILLASVLQTFSSYPNPASYPP